MTDKQLEKMGFIKDSTRIHKNRYWCNTSQCHFIIAKSYSAEDLMKLVYDEGIDAGIKEGKTIRSNEIRKLLYNQD